MNDSDGHDKWMLMSLLGRKERGKLLCLLGSSFLSDEA